GAPTSATSEPPLRINHATRAPIPTRATNNAVRSPPDSPARSVASGVPERASVSVISLALRHPPEHVVEAPAGAQILPLDGAVAPGDGAELDLGPVRLGGGHGDDLARGEVVVHLDVKTSAPSRPKVSALAPSGNCRGRTPIITRFERWIRSNDVAITALTPSRNVPLAAQSRDEPIPLSVPARTTRGTFASLYAKSGRAHV